MLKSYLLLFIHRVMIFTLTTNAIIIVIILSVFIEFYCGGMYLFNLYLLEMYLSILIYAYIYIHTGSGFLWSIHVP